MFSPRKRYGAVNQSKDWEASIIKKHTKDLL